MMMLCFSVARRWQGVPPGLDHPADEKVGHGRDLCQEDARPLRAPHRQATGTAIRMVHDILQFRVIFYSFG